MDPANSSSDASGYGEMVMKAISTINDGNGVDIDGIFEFIKERYEVPVDFRKRLRNKLKKLVSLSKLEKVENRYKIVHGNTTTIATRPTQTMNPDDSTKPQDLPTTTEETSEIIDAAVKVVAMAENIDSRRKFPMQICRCLLLSFANQDLSVSWNQHNQIDNEERKPTIGMKRPLE